MAEQPKEKRSLLQFAMIPPLPSSKGADKENAFETPFRSKNSLHKRATPHSRRRPLQDNGYDVFRSPSIQSSQYSGGRILRTGETVQSLFCLSAETPSEHVHLCQQIVEGTFSDDPSAWCRALRAACMQIASNRISENTFSSSDLMRLHRRAKARFSLLDDTKPPSEDILQIWLSYAEVQGKYVSPDEARAVYRLIQNRGYGAKLASFYVSMAKFESQFNVTKAVDIINTGIESRAEPTELLRNTLAQIVASNQDVATSSQFDSGSRKAHNLTDSQNQSKRVSFIPPLPTENRNETHSKRRKIDEDSQDPPCNTLLEDSNMSTGTVSLSLEQSIPSNNDLKPNPGQVTTERSETESEALQRKKASLQSKHISGAASKRRARVQSKELRIKPAGLSGGAKRLSPEENNSLGDSEEDDADLRPPQSDSKKKGNECSASKPVPRISRMDLSYMMNWDPNRRGSLKVVDSTKEQLSVSVVASTSVTSVDHASKLGVQTEPTEAGSKSSVVTNSSHATSTDSSQTGRCTQNLASGDLEEKPDLTNRELNGEGIKGSESMSPLNAKLLSQCNIDFLPLVHENNIVSVNKEPYIKLGIIGKGGSSKVYRVLSKSCNVLAIKKVKLSNLDQKAIDGYANEIALLKKLQGNPFIIQMHDSEIDLDRKAIFLAMEVGEVDLNHVLQQQSVQSAKNCCAGPPSLNMNFIRLTWQQMLSAVHSIHEERIIHSDLKPANFLFVRGVLKLIDFGIAKAIQTDDTTNIYRDSQIGTLNYMSPEAILDTGSGNGGARMRIGRASDIWSLGCILYQMVFGRTPFASLHMIHKLQAIVNPSHQIEYPGDVDEAAIDAIKKCLRRQPEDRPPIVGKGGLLNEHYFLNHHRTAS